MKKYNIALLPGDGIGSEITQEVLKIVSFIERMEGDVMFEVEEFGDGATQYLKTGTAMREETFKHCKDADAIYMGAIGLPEARYNDGREVNGDVIFRLRFDLDLYAGVRPVKLYDKSYSKLKLQEDQIIDYVVVRENIEGLYASRSGGTNVRGEVATDTLVITKEGTTKVVDYAFKLAQRRKGRPNSEKNKKVTCVDKANVLSSYAYFRKVFDEIASNYTGIEQDYAYVDAMTAYQVTSPDQFDVVVAENMFGDIISDLSSATVGGLGMSPSGDIGDKHAMFQPPHGTAPDIAGKGLANPISAILSLGMMLDWLGSKNQDERLIDWSQCIEMAVQNLLKNKTIITKDIGGKSYTSEVGDELINIIKALKSS